MALDLARPEAPSRPQRWLCRVDDDFAFAYARGHDFIRGSDHELWAYLSEGQLRSVRSGRLLAYQVGSMFYDATTNAPLYYQPA